MTFSIKAKVVLVPPTNAAKVAAKLRQQLNNVNANVNVKISQKTARSLQQTNATLKKTTANAKEAGKAMSSFGEQAALAGKRFLAFTVATAAILKFADAVKTGIGEAIDFQRELVKISQVTGNSIKSLGLLTKEITRLATGFGVSSTELLQASRVLAQTGLSADKTRVALEALAKSDLAPTFDNIKSTTEGAIAIFRQFGIASDKLEEKLGSINAVAGKFAVESSDIITAVRRTGGAFSAAGGSLEDLIALFTSVRSTTRESAESIATGFRTIFTRMQRVRTQNFLETLGINLKDIKGQFVGPLEAIRKLHLALANLPSTDPRFAQIIEELGGFRQVSKVIPLIQQFDVAERALNVAMGGTSSLSKDAATAQGALAIQIKKTREEFSALMRSVANSTSFKSMAVVALKLASAFIKVADALKPLLPMLTLLGGFTIGRLAGPFLKSFQSAGGFGFTGLTGKHSGGPIRKFASGGLVPGVGNTDSVPAQLTPGEYVIKKSSVKKIGVDNLQHLAEGGAAKPKFGVILPVVKASNNMADFYKPQISAKVVNEEYKKLKGKKANINRKVVHVDSKGEVDNGVAIYNIPLAYVNEKKLEKKFGEDRIKQIRQQNIQLAADLFTKSLINKEAGTQPFNGDTAVIGHIFEDLVNITQKSFTVDPKKGSKGASGQQTRNFDFPHGIRGTNNNEFAKLFSQDIFNDDDMKIDAKATLDSVKDQKSGMRPKVASYIAKNLIKNKSYDDFRLEPLHTPVSSSQKVATGGQITQPNALLTPGEYVVDKHTASRLGMDTLEHLNKHGSLPGYASGGSYGSVFKPHLTGRGLGAGNLGRKKQWKVQRKAFLERGKKLGVLSPQEQQELMTLAASIGYMAKSRTPRHARFLGFNKGGLFGSLKRYADGGPNLSGRAANFGINNFASLGFALSGVTALVSTFKGLNKTVDTLMNTMTQLGSQAAMLFITFKTLVNYGGHIDANLAKSQNELNDFKGQKENLAPKLQAAQNKFDTVSKKYDAELKKNKSGFVSKKTGAAKTKSEGKLRQLQQESDAIDKNIAIKQQEYEKNVRISKLATRTAVAFASVIAASQVLATALEKAGRQQIAEGGSTGKFIAGKTLSGASKFAGVGGTVGGGIGAALGTLGGPFAGLTVPAGYIGGTVIGTAVSAVGGAVYGYETGTTEANNMVVMREFNKRIKDTSDIFDRINKKLTTYSLQQSKLQYNLHVAQKDITTKGISADSRQNITAGIGSQKENYFKFFQDAAKHVKTFGEFMDKIGKDTLLNFAVVTGQSFHKLKEIYQHQIAEQNKAIKAQKKLTEVIDKYSMRMKEILAISKSFEDVTDSMKEFSSSMSSLFDIAGGGNGLNFKVFDNSNRLKNPAGFGNVGKFQEIVKRDIANNPLLQQKTKLYGGKKGEETTLGQSMSKDLLAAQDAVERLPAVLLNLRNSIGSFDPKKAVDKLLEQFSEAPKFVQDALRIAANNIIGSGGKEEKLISAIQDDLIGVSKKLAAAFKPTFETGAKISKAMTEEKNRRLQFIGQLANLNKQELDLRMASFDNKAQAEQLRAQMEGRPTNLNKLQSLDDKKLKAFGVGRDPRAIGLRLETAKNRLLKLQNQLAKKSTDDGKKLNAEIRKQSDIIVRSRGALAFLSDVGARAAIVMQKFTRAQAKAKFKTDLLDRGMSLGSISEARSLSSLLHNVRVVGKTRNIDNVRPEQRSELVSFLKSMGNMKMDMFGGDTAKKVLEDMRKNFAIKMGLNAKDAEKYAKGSSSEIDKLHKSLMEIIKKSNDAIEVSRKAINDNINTLIKKLNTSIDKFTAEIKKLINHQLVVSETEKLSGARGSKAKLTTAKSNLEKYMKMYGIQGQTAAQKEERVRKIAANLDKIKAVGNFEKQEPKLSRFIQYAKKASTTAYGFGTGHVITKGVGFGGRASTSVEYGNTANTFAKKIANAGNLSGQLESKKISRADFRSRLEAMRKTVESYSNSTIADDFMQKMQKKVGFDNSNQTTVGDISNALKQTLKDTAKSAQDMRNANDLARAQIIENIGGLGTLNFTKMATDFNTISEDFKTFADTKSLAEIEKQLGLLAKAIEKSISNIKKLGGKVPEEKPIKNQLGGLIRFAKGGTVPGYGTRDSVPALLTPGETVVPRLANGGLVDEIAKAMEANAKKRKAAALERGEKLLDEGTKNYEDRMRVVEAHKDRIAKYKKTYVTTGGVFDNKEDYLNYMNQQQDFNKALREDKSHASLLARMRGEKTYEVDGTTYDVKKFKPKNAKQARYARLAHKKTHAEIMSDYDGRKRAGEEARSRGNLTYTYNGVEYQVGSRGPLYDMSTKQAEVHKKRHKVKGLSREQRLQAIINHNAKRDHVSREQASINIIKHRVGDVGARIVKTAKTLYNTFANRIKEYRYVHDPKRIESGEYARSIGATHYLYKGIEFVVGTHGAKNDTIVHKKFKSGAFVPGRGSGDKVPAMLEPGEFVLNRNAVQAIGPQTLDHINRKHSRFQTGGIVGMQTGGNVESSPIIPDFNALNTIVQTFGNKVDLLAESLNNINGLEIQLTATHTVNVTINGAAVLQQLQPSIQQLIVEETNKAINNMLASKFPKVGKVL